MRFTPINFGQSDEALYKEVREYQQREGFKTFSEAGRKLVEAALLMEKVKSEQKKKKK